MFKIFFGYFLALHVLGDFYFQSNRLAENKAKKFQYVLLHSAIYIVITFFCVIPFWSKPIFVAACILALLHFVIDSGKFLYSKRTKEYHEAVVFSVDQLIHLACITLIASLLTYHGFDLQLLSPISDYVSYSYVNPAIIFQWVGLFLVIIKPANITIKQLTVKYRPVEKNIDTNKAGGFIGALERLVIVLLLSVAQFAAIGLVLTAKSVARYNKISESEHFAEFYLLGTLLSTLFAIIAFFIYI